MTIGLHAWIQPQHLTESAILLYRESFQRHPARLLVLKNFLPGGLASRLGQFLQAEAIFQLAHGLYSAEEEAPDGAAWERAEEADRFFRFSKLIGVSPQFHLSPNALTYLRFRSAFQRADVKTYFERLSMSSLGWSDSFGCHAMRAGDFLKAHDDNGKNRKLALVFYLTPGWEPRFGGALVVVSSNGETTRIAAEYNSAVIFDVTAGSKHFIEPIVPEAETKSRMTISGWYLNAGEASRRRIDDIVRTV
jgi:hypothetical protein